MEWEDKLREFLKEIDLKDDIIGVLACGSYITGHPSSHSDLDVHLILNEKVDYRERGNRIVDGLLIEYFANTPNQIRQYMEQDYNNITPMSLVQFRTGLIMMDTNGEVHKLKEEATKLLRKKYNDVSIIISEFTKYNLWDKLDDLKDLYELNREDFDYVYYVNLNELLKVFYKLKKIPYNRKSVLGHINSSITRKKYLLDPIKDDKMKELVSLAITGSKSERMEKYEEITNIVFDLSGGFNIDGYKYRSKKEII